MTLAAAIDVCTEYNVALAVEDFVPVLLAGTAFWFLAQAVRRAAPQAYQVALIGGAIVTAGGLGKAVWKILVATGCWNFQILENLLFPCLAFGFSAVAWAVMCVLRERHVTPWPFVAFPLAAGLGAGQMSWAAGEYKNWPLLIAAAVAACVTAICLAIIAFRAGRPSVGALFVVYTIGTNVLPPLAARPHQSLQVQWAEQLTNSAIQLCFLLGALWLRAHLNQRASRAGIDESTGVSA